jgi:ribose transport system substrate-binding protein
MKACTTCTSSDVMYFTATQIANQLGPEVVSYVRSHPDVTYIYGAFDPPSAAMVTALQTAGLGKSVKLVGVLGNAQNLDFVRNGQVQVADAAYDNTYMGFAMVDQAIRLLNGEAPIEPAGEGLPFQVLDKSNLPEGTKSWTAPYDYESEFLKLWGVAA